MNETKWNEIISTFDFSYFVMENTSTFGLSWGHLEKKRKNPIAHDIHRQANEFDSQFIWNRCDNWQRRNSRWILCFFFFRVFFCANCNERSESTQLSAPIAIAMATTSDNGAVSRQKMNATSSTTQIESFDSLIFNDFCCFCTVFFLVSMHWFFIHHLIFQLDLNASLSRSVCEHQFCLPSIDTFIKSLFYCVQNDVRHSLKSHWFFSNK